MAEQIGFDIQAIARCAQILRQIEPGIPLSPAVLARKLGIARSTLHRYLDSMVKADMIRRIGKAEYAAGPLLLHLGAVGLSVFDVQGSARGIMQKLCNEIGETVVLSIWGGLSAVVSRVELPNRLINVTVQPGTMLPLNAAQTRIFLAFLDDRETVERLLALVPSQRAKLQSDMDSARQNGYLYYAGAVRGLGALGVPIFNALGITATLAVVATEAELSGPARGGFVTELVAAGSTLSQNLGAPRADPAGDAAAHVS